MVLLFQSCSVCSRTVRYRLIKIPDSTSEKFTVLVVLTISLVTHLFGFDQLVCRTSKTLRGFWLLCFVGYVYQSHTSIRVPANCSNKDFRKFNKDLIYKKSFCFEFWKKSWKIIDIFYWRKCNNYLNVPVLKLYRPFPEMSNQSSHRCSLKRKKRHLSKKDFLQWTLKGSQE